MIVTIWIVEIMSVMFLMPTQEFGGTVMMPISQKLVIFQKGYIQDRVTNQQQQKRKMMSGSKEILFVVYIRKKPYSIWIYFFQEFINMSKIII